MISLNLLVAVFLGFFLPDCKLKHVHVWCCLLQVTVSSGGMLTQKLNVDDLQFEKATFDGTMAYAQNKVRQI